MKNIHQRDAGGEQLFNLETEIGQIAARYTLGLAPALLSGTEQFQSAPLQFLLKVEQGACFKLS